MPPQMRDPIKEMGLENQLHIVYVNYANELEKIFDKLKTPQIIELLDWIDYPEDSELFDYYDVLIKILLNRNEYDFYISVDRKKEKFYI